MQTYTPIGDTADEETFESDGTVDAAYRGRNHLAQLCAYLAKEKGWDTWIDPSDPEWPILFIELPEGQISYHIPLNDLTHFMSDLPRNTKPWDGHTVQEAERRILRTLP